MRLSKPQVRGMLPAAIVTAIYGVGRLIGLQGWQIVAIVCGITLVVIVLGYVTARLTDWLHRQNEAMRREIEAEEGNADDPR